MSTIVRASAGALCTAVRAVAVVGFPKASDSLKSVMRKLPFASGLPTCTVITTVPPPPGGIESKNQTSSSWAGGGTDEMNVTAGSYVTSMRVATEVDVPMFPKLTVYVIVEPAGTGSGVETTEI